jgi:hypothetical protein
MHRNWTAVGKPDLPLYPIVAPYGLVIGTDKVLLTAPTAPPENFPDMNHTIGWQVSRKMAR